MPSSRGIRRSSDEAVEALLMDLATTNAAMLEIVQQVRETVSAMAGEVAETVKYGGIIFTQQGQLFCGVYAYREHVSVEFGQGSTFEDPHNVLEGGGKYRRHIKLHGVDDVQRKHLAEYVKQAVSKVA